MLPVTRTLQAVSIIEHCDVDMCLQLLAGSIASKGSETCTISSAPPPPPPPPPRILYFLPTHPTLYNDKAILGPGRRPAH